VRRFNRNLEFALLTVVGIAGYVVCGLNHICIAGHLHHATDWRGPFLFDALWVFCLGAAALSVVQSNVPHRWAACALLWTLIFSRLLAASGGGRLMLIELAMVIYLFVSAILGVLRCGRKEIVTAEPSPSPPTMA
jgi:hypothetical protein